MVSGMVSDGFVAVSSWFRDGFGFSVLEWFRGGFAECCETIFSSMISVERNLDIVDERLPKTGNTKTSGIHRGLIKKQLND